MKSFDGFDGGFDGVMELTRAISGHTAFEDPECRAYYDLISNLPPGSNIVEIGLQFGRSSSIALQVAGDRGLRYWGVDPFLEPPMTGSGWLDMAAGIGAPFALLRMKSEQAAPYLPSTIHLALIDGDHWEAGVRVDCQLLMPRMASGGLLLFHDYGRESLPNVYPTVRAEMIQSIMAGNEWIEHPTVGCLGIWRKK